jgi:hypothetical protein
MTRTTYLRCASGLVFAILASGCTSESGPDDVSSPDAATVSCGNGTCEAGETTSSCAADCAEPPACGDGTCKGDETPASCPADCPTMCGNGVCEVGETISSCAADCATASCTASDPSSCTGETVCISGSCVNAFGRNYRIKVVSALFTQKKADGSSWDIGGGLPDPKVTITINGVATTTPVIDNTLTPTWNFVTPPTLIPGGTVFQIQVVDADLAADDPAWSCTNNPLAADLIRAGARCSGVGALAAAHVDVTFTPN